MVRAAHEVAKFSKSANQYVNKRDYILTMDTAKEIAMIQGNKDAMIALLVLISRLYPLQCFFPCLCLLLFHFLNFSLVLHRFSFIGKIFNRHLK